MPNTIFTDAGRALIAQCFAENNILDITELVFCDVPGLNVNETPSATAPLPPLAQIVHRATPSKGLFNPTTAVFSTIIDAEIGDFYINYMGLMSGTTLIAVSVMPRHIKYATSEFKTGNSLVKNFALELQNASALTGITIPAELWMWDFDERYAALDHDHDDQYEVINAVSDHNASEAPHPDKFEPLGAVADHNEDPAAHGGLLFPGAIVATTTSTVPDGYLECDGASLTRASYSGLFTAIGTIYGSADEDHFNIPDYRGQFLRGWDHGAGIDPDVATRTDSGDGSTTGDYVGTKQTDALQNITGSYIGSYGHSLSFSGEVSGAFSSSDISTSNRIANSGSGAGYQTLSIDASLVARTASETRPTNINVMYCIKY